MGKVFGVVTAAVAGFVAGILLAPKSGEETRKEIKKKALEAKVYAGEKAVEAKAAAKEAAVTLKQTAGRAEDEVVGLAKSAKKSARVVAGEAAKLGGEAQTRATRVVDEARRTVVQNHPKGQ